MASSKHQNKNRKKDGKNCVDWKSLNVKVEKSGKVEDRGRVRVDGRDVKSYWRAEERRLKGKGKLQS